MEILTQVWTFIRTPFINIGDMPISLLGVFKLAAVFWLGFFFGKLFRHRIMNIKSLAISDDNKVIISTLGYYAILITTVIVGLTALGINLSSLAMLASAISVGIGFGLQNIVANFISGIILMFEKSIRPGDLIELPTKERGWIKEINMRSTILITSDNIEIIAPNQTFITQNIVNLSYSDNVRRIFIYFSAAYGSDVNKVKNIVIEKVQKSDLKFVREKGLSVRLTSLGDSALNFALAAYINTEINANCSYEYDFLPLIYDALNEAKIAIPFPQLDVSIKQN
ncbi:MAG: mechanosensitive ion channel [Helicobacteraceae bacterium]|nr:mechanosensitive ion channel [Helicobacteraceae bacterium]